MPARRSSAARKAEPGVIRLVEASGASKAGWEAAVADALKKAGREVAAPLGLEVTRFWAETEGTAVRRYRVTVKVAYRQALRAPARGRTRA